MMSAAAGQDDPLQSLDPQRKAALDARLNNNNSQTGFSNDSFASDGSESTVLDGTHSSQRKGQRKRGNAGQLSNRRKQSRPNKRDPAAMSRRPSVDLPGPGAPAPVDHPVIVVDSSSPPRGAAASSSTSQSTIKSYFNPGAASPAPSPGTAAAAAAFVSPERPLVSPTRAGPTSPWAAEATGDDEWRQHMTAKVADLTATVASKDARLQALADKAQRLELQCQQRTEALEREVRLRTKMWREQVQERNLNNTHRLGWETFSNGHKQTWTKGSAFVDLERRREVLAATKAELDQERKNLTASKKSELRRQSSASAADSIDKDGFQIPAVLPRHFEQESLVITLKLEALKQEEKKWVADSEGLQQEFNVHMRETKRIEAERHAKYKAFPCKLAERYVLMCLLGRGGFSEVYKAYDLLECREVACKIHQVDRTWSVQKRDSYIKHATREFTIHRELDNAHIVKLFDVFETDDTSFCTVLEYCNDNDLDFLLKQNGTLSERDAKSKISQIVSALEYLNSFNPETPIIHYDLKPANVLFHHGRVKLTDFGLSKISSPSSRDESGNIELTSQGAGTYWYLPPETFITDKKAKISDRVDVWSVGVIFYQCLYGMRPFGHQESQTALFQRGTILNAGAVEFPDKPKVSEAAKTFIRHCLTHEPHKRPTVMELATDAKFAYLFRK